MKHLNSFEQLFESGNNRRPTAELNALPRKRKYKGDRYREELLPRFIHLRVHDDRMKEPVWFQHAMRDGDFRMMILTQSIGRPDVASLWRDLVGRPNSRNKMLVAGLTAKNKNGR